MWEFAGFKPGSGIQRVQRTAQFRLSFRYRHQPGRIYKHCRLQAGTDDDAGNRRRDSGVESTVYTNVTAKYPLPKFNGVKKGGE